MARLDFETVELLQGAITDTLKPHCQDLLEYPALPVAPSESKTRSSWGITDLNLSYGWKGKCSTIA
jgi:hypothetical protein